MFFSDFVILSTKIPHRQDSLRGSPAVFAAPCGVLCWYACFPVLFIGLSAKSAAASLASGLADATFNPQVPRFVLFEVSSRRQLRGGPLQPGSSSGVKLFDNSFKN